MDHRTSSFIVEQNRMCIRLINSLINRIMQYHSRVHTGVRSVIARTKVRAERALLGTDIPLLESVLPCTRTRPNPKPRSPAGRAGPVRVSTRALPLYGTNYHAAHGKVRRESGSEVFPEVRYRTADSDRCPTAPLILLVRHESGSEVFPEVRQVPPPLLLLLVRRESAPRRSSSALRPPRLRAAALASKFGL